jgi:hypothetical protein
MLGQLMDGSRTDLEVSFVMSLKGNTSRTREPVIIYLLNSTQVVCVSNFSETLNICLYYSQRPCVDKISMR